MNENHVAIIGAAGRFPGAGTTTDLQVLLTAGRVAHQPVPAMRWDHGLVYSPDRRASNRTPAQLGGFMDGIDRFCPEYFGLSPKRAKIMDPQQRLMLETVRQALDDAGYRRRYLADGRTGVYVGASSSDYRGLVTAGGAIDQILAGRVGEAWAGTGTDVDAEVARLSGAIPALSGYTIVGQQVNMIAAQVSEAFDFRGPAFAVDTACSSALVALHEAVGHLRSGQVDAAVVGGVYVLLDPVMMMCFSRIGALSRTDRCRPFASQADGFVLGEGVGAVVLKRLADAMRDGDPIAAVIAGTAVNNDGKGGGPFTPLLRGQRDVLAQAWRDAAEDPADVDLVEAHGTATKVGDRVELEAVSSHFSEALARRRVALGAVKANLGHTVAASGMASLLKTVLALQGRQLFGQPGAESERPAVREAGFSMDRETGKADGLRLAGVNAFGFGGTNAHVVLKAAPSRTLRGGEAGTVRWVFSAPDEEALRGYLESCYGWLRERRGWTGRGVAAVLDRREMHAVECRLDGANETELGEALAAVVGRRWGEDGMEDVWADEAGGAERLPPLRLTEGRYWIVDETKRGTRSMQAPVEATTQAESQEKLASAEEAVWAALVEVTGMGRSQITRGLGLKRDLGFDSLMALELGSALEKRWPEAPDIESIWTGVDLTVAELLAKLLGDDKQGAPPPVEVRVEQEVPRETGNWREWPELRALDRRRKGFEETGATLPYFQVSEPGAPGCCRIDGRELINFSSYDYLGLSRDPRVIGATAEAVERWGASANASRIAAGERPIHGELEAALAGFLGTPDCLTMVGGYGTNVSVIGHLLGPGDLLLHDKLAHESILAGGRLSGAQLRAFRHNDPEDLERELELWRPLVRRVLIAVEGVYSMDGDLVPLPDVVALKQRYDALLLVDEAHSLGVIGATGRGVGEHFGVARADVDLWMGTMSKALASCGGYLAGERRLIEYLRYTMPGFVYSVGLPPAQAAAARAALGVLGAEPERVSLLRRRSEELRGQFGAVGIDVGLSRNTAVVPWMVGTSDRALACAEGLRRGGVFVHPVIAPAVEEGAARLRFFVTAAHDEDQIATVVAAVGALLSPA